MVADFLTMLSLVFGDPEVRRLAREFDKVTGNVSVRAVPKRPTYPKTTGSPVSLDFTAKPRMDVGGRAAGPPLGIIVTQLQVRIVGAFYCCAYIRFCRIQNGLCRRVSQHRLQHLVVKGLGKSNSG